MTAVAPTGTAGVVTTAGQIAERTVRQLARTPQVLVVAIVQGVAFLLVFRYVFGGAIGVGGVDYVDFLVPGFVVAGLLFTAGGTAVAVAEDAASGAYERLRSLPIPDAGVLAGRALADTAFLLFCSATVVVTGLAVGFRPAGDPAQLAVAAGLLAAFAFALSWVFIALGLVAGSAQAAQGLGLLGVPFSFLSSAFVPVATMPKVLRIFAEHQPMTLMVNAVRGLVLDRQVDLAHSTGWYVTGSLLWAMALTLVLVPLAIRAYRR